MAGPDPHDDKRVDGEQFEQAQLAKIRDAAGSLPPWRRGVRDVVTETEQTDQIICGRVCLPPVRWRNPS